MEDDPDDHTSSAVVSSPPLKNGEFDDRALDDMANFPNTDDNPPVATISPSKVNGSANPVKGEQDDRDSSDCDALVIDEGSDPTTKKPKLDNDGDGEEFRHTNPYFSESIFDLSTQYRPQRPTKGNGLQPTVQFKCSKCFAAGFQSLQVLNEHHSTCTAPPVPSPPATPLPNNGTNFRVTRKVFLCSACGTYYENWNLFLHMREVHKRYICLYCLGMFPHAEKLSVHLTSKHNCNPKHYESVADFLNIYKDPCFLMCCDCQMVFNEQEDFTGHSCVETAAIKVSPAKNEDELQEAAEREKITKAAVCEISENHLSENDRSLSVERLEVEREQDREEKDQNRSARVVNSKECSDSNSEVNVVENENEEGNNALLETSDNSVGEVRKETENEEESKMERMVIKEEEPERGGDDSMEPEDEENLDTVINKNDVSEDSDNKLNDQSETDEAPEQEPAADDEEVEEEEEEEEQQPVVETEVRKVPKVTLRLPKITTPYNPAEEEDEEDYQSEDSEKLTMEVEKENNSDVDVDVVNEQLENECDGVNLNQSEDLKGEVGLCLPTAGPDVPVIELELEQPLDKFDIKLLLQKCLRSTVGGCLYCNHARKIAVNGKQLGLHAISEHRYSAIVKSITAEELIPESFNTRIKESLEELEEVYFNLESTSSEGGVTFSHIFECFQCRYSTSVHKELYLHNRKLHAKAILLCTMCKMSFYSYCELICHLCPGLYVLDNDVQFRCCLCVSDDLPSAFRLMVHLRKKHHVCDVCLDMCHDQSRLSNHVWKHKLHHLCYRCGIAYRNKPDITKHLFWKHGTESVLCKKCLQKKWPHVYHFCIPPVSFTCEECSLSFARAVSLMVHKRLHTEVYPHTCPEEGCTEKFISKKLLAKHEFRHRQPIEEVKQEEEVKEVVEVVKDENDEVKEEEKEVKEEDVVEEKPVEKTKPKVDVYDLPELNLSESDSSESEDESPKSAIMTADETKPEPTDTILEISHSDDILKTDEPPAEKKPDSEENQIPVLENIWDDFKNYQANIAKLDILTDVGNEDDGQPEILTDIEPQLTHEVALRDHDYCAPTMDTLKEEDGLPQPASEKDTSADHDYCNAKEKEKRDVNPLNNHKQNNAKDSSDSSSDSDSSSCTCGSNCSCSSASSSSSSSSDSSESDSSSEEGRRRQQIRREKRRQKKPKKVSENVTVDVEAVASENTARPRQQNQQQQPQPVIPSEAPILESDLETTESDTDEDFYDKEPQKLANKLLAEKREKLLQMAGIGPYINGSMIDSRPSTPSLMVEDKKPSKKKSKSKKKKKRKSSKHELERPEVNILNNYPLTLMLPKNSPVRSPTVGSLPANSHLPPVTSAGESDSNTRASKRRRVPNKFYGYSSDEEGEKLTPMQQSIKMRKLEVPTPKSPLVVPPLTIKAAPSTPTVEPISIRMSSKPGEMKVQPLRLPFAKRMAPKLKPLKQPPLPPPLAVAPTQDSNSDSNSTSSDDEPKMSINIGGPPPPHMGAKPKETPALYCYCRCPYDEVSEMIGCDSDDCAIEWFHFECVGIMVPPKGQWYCPDCRKKKQQRREAFQAQM